MDDKQIEELENEDMWDLDAVETQKPVAPGRAVVSVSLPRADFDAIADAARDEGVSISEFMRSAALARATPGQTGSRVIAVSGASRFNGVGSNDTVAWRHAERPRFDLPPASRTQ